MDQAPWGPDELAWISPLISVIPLWVAKPYAHDNGLGYGYGSAASPGTSWHPAARGGMNPMPPDDPGAAAIKNSDDRSPPGGFFLVNKTYTL